MRMRALLVAAVTAALVPVLAPVAQAGQTFSTWCSDGTTAPGGREIPILTSPITLGAEIWSSPTDLTHQVIQLCFSDSPVGTPSRVSGGTIQVVVDTSTSTAMPSAYVTLNCAADGGTFLTCNNSTGATATPGDLGVSTPPSTTCLVSIGSGCVLSVPGVKVATDKDASRPLLAVTLLGLTVPANVPTQCVAVVVTCP
jgi:hypothetical protein